MHTFLVTRAAGGHFITSTNDSSVAHTILEWYKEYSTAVEIFEYFPNHQTVIYHNRSAPHKKWESEELSG